MIKFVQIGALCAAFAVPAALAGTQKTYDFTGFDELDIAAGVQVEYTAGPAYSVVADFERGGPDDLKVRQDGDRLYIARKATTGWGDKVRVTIRVTAPKLDEIEASSGSSLDATGIDTESLFVDVSSGASVDASGTCGKLKVKVNSGGSANLREVKCHSVEASASSGGSASAYADTDAESHTSSGGSVSIWGSPEQRYANKSISGGSTDFRGN